MHCNIDIVAHSMGYAYAKGIVDFLKPYVSANNTLGNFYVVAPENAIGHPTSTDATYRLNVSNFESVFQYGSNFTNDNNGNPVEKYCFRDGVAPQVAINANPPVPNFFIPTTSKYKPIREFNKAHYIANYGWIFTDPIAKPTIRKRNQ